MWQVDDLRQPGSPPQAGGGYPRPQAEPRPVRAKARSVGLYLALFCIAFYFFDADVAELHAHRGALVQL